MVCQVPNRVIAKLPYDDSNHRAANLLVGSVRPDPRAGFSSVFLPCDVRVRTVNVQANWP